MQPTDLFLQLCGVDEAKTAGAVLARQWRSRLRETSLWTGAKDEPISSDFLKAFGKLRGIVEYKFKAPLACEGLITALPNGGFSVSVARSERTSRARYTLAHEIGHTFFYDLSHAPPRRLTPYNRGRAATEEVRKATRQEEQFCDAFAAEFLFPSEAAECELESCASIGDTSELLRLIEKVGKRWGVSVEVALRRLNEVYGPRANADRVVSVMRWRPNSKTGSDPGVRVTQSFPRPCGDWFLPTNTRARSVGLFGASFLFEWWQYESKKTIGRHKSNGIFGFQYELGHPRVIENDLSPTAPCLENLLLWRRCPTDGRWRRVKVSATVTYRLYAVSTSEAYSVALINLSKP
jgi:hypothetical protein